MQRTYTTRTEDSTLSNKGGGVGAKFSSERARSVLKVENCDFEGALIGQEVNTVEAICSEE